MNKYFNVRNIAKGIAAVSVAIISFVTLRRFKTKDQDSLEMKK